jgi:peptidoglycan/LPS O-acetylase OafA/YrhL
MVNSKKSEPRWDWARLEKWHVAPSNSENFEFLDGIRGIAILLVVCCHLFYINPNATGIVKFVGNVLGAGHLGVTVFFTLSGFLISLPFWKGKSQGRPILLKSYFLRRIWKIYPPLALSVILLLPFYIGIYGHSWDYTKTALEWLLGIAWLTPVSGRLNPVMWSLIVEVHFYLILPLAFHGLKKVSYSKTLWLLFLGLLLAPPAAKQLYTMHGLEFSNYPLMRVNFPVKMDAFAAGVLVAGLYQQGRLQPRLALLGPLGMFLLAGTLGMAGVAALVPTVHGLWTPHASHYGAMLASACLLCFVAKPALATRWGLSFSGLRWLGLISYEWYLFHQPPYFWMRNIFGSADGNFPKYLAFTMLPFCGSLILAAAVYWKFSLPILRKHRG